MLYHFYLLSSFYFLVSVEVILDAELSLYLFSPHFYKITVKNICLWWACLKQICTFFPFFKLTMKHQERTHVWDNVYSQQKSQNHREDQTNVFKSFFPAHQHLVTVFKGHLFLQHLFHLWKLCDHGNISRCKWDTFKTESSLKIKKFSLFQPWTSDFSRSNKNRFTDTSMQNEAEHQICDWFKSFFYN